MAHKIKIKRVRHVNRDGSLGTKNDFIVRCKCRGKVCTEKKFATLREAESAVSAHWDNLQLSRRGGWTYPSQRKHTATPRQRKTRLRVHLGFDASNFTNGIQAVQKTLAGVHAA